MYPSLHWQLMIYIPGEYSVYAEDRIICRVINIIVDTHVYHLNEGQFILYGSGDIGETEPLTVMCLQGLRMGRFISP